MCKARLQCRAYYEKLQKAVIHNKTTIGEKKGKAKQRIKMGSCIFYKVERLKCLNLIGLPTQ